MQIRPVLQTRSYMMFVLIPVLNSLVIQMKMTVLFLMLMKLAQMLLKLALMLI